MKIFRATNPEVMALLKDDLIETRVEWYKIMMTERPEDVCVIVIVDGGDIVGHGIARVIENFISGERYAWLDSAKNGTGINVSVAAFNIMIEWCKENNLKVIKAEVKRGLVALYEQYQFNEHAVVISKEVK